MQKTAFLWYFAEREGTQSQSRYSKWRSWIVDIESLYLLLLLFILNFGLAKSSKPVIISYKDLPPYKEWPLFDRQSRPRSIVREWTAEREIQKSSDKTNNKLNTCGRVLCLIVTGKTPNVWGKPCSFSKFAAFLTGLCDYEQPRGQSFHFGMKKNKNKT